MKTLKTILTAGMAMLMLAGCGSTQAESQTVQSQSSASAEASQSTPDYSAASLAKAESDCEGESVPGKDVILPSDNEKTLSLMTVTGDWMDSDLYQCVVESLELPDDVVAKISDASSSGEQTTTYGKLTLLWEKGKSLYASVDPSFDTGSAKKA
ncbi:MAG: hypothetical protein SO360_01975 [Bifidobacterium tsurumiense]|uniref:hypothetical protein n=1 Tax=Bifidobacterium tsurumiense TaxID=356829 RepID=UPI002A7EAF88|nr:hypothetical protein [Bifidobacterium tsurumiense]MDY4677621.1 hypothetical protein [Bifidobacterium tsurumiense]